MIDLLLENLGLVIDADGDGKRIRDAILQLAVRGRLVAQEAGDEEFPSWEDQVSLAKDRLRELGLGKPKRSGEPIVDDLLPPGWRWDVMANLGLIVGGGTPKSGEASYWAEVGDGVPWVTPADLEDPGPVEIGAGRRDISEAGLENSSARLLPTGTVLFSSRAPIGKVAISANPLATNQGFKSCVPYLSEAARYVYLWLLVARDGIEESATGTTFKEISGKEFGKVPIPVPPLAEQHRIVAKVDELMGHAAVVEERHLAASSARVRFRDAALHALAEAEDHEAVERAWSRIEENFDDLFTEPEDIQPLRQTILQLAIRGRLVSQEAGDEDIDSVLKSVATERKATGLNAPARGWKSSPVEAGEVIDRIADSWSWVRLGDVLLDVEAGHSPQALKRPRIEDEWGVLKVSSCSWGKFLPEENKALPTGYLVDTEAEVRDGDLLISRANTVELIARSVVVDSPPTRLMLSDKTLRLVSWSGVSKKYLNIANGSATARIHYEANATGTSASMRNVGQSVICDTPIPLPPLAEQHQIVAKVDELMALCDTLETSLERSKTTREQFANSISSAIASPATIGDALREARGG